MRTDPETMDILRAVTQAAEISRTGRALRRAYLQGRQDELLSVFEEYRNQDRPLAGPDPDVISMGFIWSWKQKDYWAIVEVGARLGDEFYRANREAHAFYLAAKKRVPDNRK